MLDRLLVVLDESDTSEIAITEALHVAQAHGSALLFVGILPSLKLPLLHLPSPALVGVTAVQEASEARVQSHIDRGMREAARLRLRAAFHTLQPPHHATAVVALAAAETCDTIIIASDGRSALGRLLAGSLIPGLITHAPMPVLVCKANREETPVRATAQRPTRDPLAAWRQRQRAVDGGLIGAPA